ncbi:helix-turn-helix domain-containing protein [Devosia nitrariae]|uniref:HTH cro/C1-type domain-containing protein n=1 Tax=Devosia nitrariae TaxID=2071872 RepID=A0ABQ5VZH5_9HYPH|nr:helix-turn-helix transcriptional regulator [Devosia nitrariae]GLQ53199.1 hypothetical protein GCM10010862_04570 [Devosia nitrariae]
MPNTTLKVDKAWFEAQMKEQGLSLRALAAKIDMDPSALSRSLNAQRKLSSQDIRSLARAFGKTPGDVLEHIDVAEATPVVTHSNTTAGFGEMQQRRFAPKAESKAGEPGAGQEVPARHPIWGVWKGLVTLDPNHDYTQPADTDWGKVYED